MNQKLTLHNPKFLKLFSFIVFVFWLFLFYQKIDLPKRLPERPNQWSQIDRASMALSYHKDKAPFLLPRCHQATNNPEGITAGEFPLIPYSVAKLYSAFGFHEIYHRLFVLILSLIGFIFCYFLALKLLDSPFWASFSAIAWLASPNIIYYSFSFLPDTPALAFIIIATYFLFRNRKTPSAIDFIFFTLFFALAGLIRVSSTFPLLSIALAYFISYSSSRLSGTKKKLSLVLACTIPLLLAAGWVLYSRWILHHYHIFTFLMEPMPPETWLEFKTGMKILFHNSNQYYINGFYFFLLLSTVIGVFFIKRSNKFLLLAALFTYISFGTLLMVLFKKGIEHNYYWVPFQIAFFFHIAWFADIIAKIKTPIWIKIFIGAAALVFINYNAIHVQKKFKQRWEEKQNAYEQYNDLEPYLESLGITYDKRVATYHDPTFNNTLYLMNRKGWALDKDEEMGHFHKALGTCDYAVLNDTNIIHNQELARYFGALKGIHKGLFIYSLQPSKD